VSIPSSDRWQLPDGVDELLPDAARKVERIRRRIMDHCHRCGYDLVIPPVIEYLDSLLTGTGETMNLQTFKLVDQHNGRTMGIRADLTPQVARMDAHALRSDQPNRFFYTGTVLRARTDGFGGSRAPIQFGAELFGHAGPESDIEIVRLMLDSLEQAGIESAEILVDLGHVGVYRALIEALNLSDDAGRSLFDAVRRGSVPDVMHWAANQENDDIAGMLIEVMRLRGDESVLDDVRVILEAAPNAVQLALQNLDDLISGVKKSHPQVRINIDLSELRGYQYHTGVLFAAYTNKGVELARGGRYDAVGAAFGHPRPATGFSGDLKTLVRVQSGDDNQPDGIFVEAALVDEALDEIARIRKSGERVVTELVGQAQHVQIAGCGRQLVRKDGRWIVQRIS